MGRKKRNSNRMYSKSYYNYGSEAYEYYPEEDYERKRRRVKKRTAKRTRKRTERRTEKKVKNKVLHKTHYEFVNEKKGNFKVCFSIGTLFTFIISFVCLFAVNSKKESEINTNIAELKRLEEANSVLKTEMTKNINLEEVEKVAKTRLNMQKPSPHQIVYINIPKKSYTVQYNLPDEDEEEFSLSTIWNNLFGD